MQYVNISVLVLLINFNISGDDLSAASGANIDLQGLPILNGSYGAFSVDWYADIGSSICITLILQTLFPHFSSIGQFLVSITKRCLNRGCALRLHANKDEDSALNTSFHMQSQLEELYKGPQISSAYVYSQVTTLVWSVLTFSASMPFLYVVATAYFVIYYMVYHYLLLNYYSKTSQFNEDLPIFNLQYMFRGLWLHLAIGLVCLGNKNIIPSARLGGISG